MSRLVYIVTITNTAMTEARVVAHKATEREAAAAVKLVAYGGYAGPVSPTRYPVGKVIKAADYPA